jgi:two-component sensor histidine kinase
MDRFQSGLFRRIVFLHMIQALVLSVIGIVDSAVVGSFLDAAPGNILAEARGDITMIEQVAEASDKVIRLCEEHDVDRKQAFNMGLCLDELAANSLLHGFKDDRESRLQIPSER